MRIAVLAETLTVARECLLVAALLTIGTALSGQNVIHRAWGNAMSDLLGSSVDGVPDLDGDGFADFIIGVPGDDTSAWEGGSVRVYSGATGSLLYTRYGGSANDWFGAAVSGIGDVDGDGAGDFIVGAPGNGNNGVDSGSARVFSGRSGVVLFTIYGDSAGDRFGHTVSGAGDVDDDGFADFLVGAAWDDDRGRDSGSATVFSGRDGSVLYRVDGTAAGDWFGVSVGGAGDVDGDGFTDFIVGAPGDDTAGVDAGRATVFSGAGGHALRTFTGNARGQAFGAAVNGAGDVDADGYADVIIGAWGDATYGRYSGGARVYSGRTGGLLFSFHGDSANDFFGYAVSGAGDFNADGFADLLVGARDDSLTGTAWVFSGRDGRLLGRFAGDSPDDAFGVAVGDAGDVDCDGFDDVIVGASADDNNGSNSGGAQVISGLIRSSTHPPMVKLFGHACRGADGRLPQLGIELRPVLGGSGRLAVRAAPRASPAAYLNLGLVRQGIDLGAHGLPGCSIWVAPLWSTTRSTDALGRSSVTLVVPNDAGLLSAVFHAQWLVVDGMRLVTTTGAMLRIGIR